MARPKKRSSAARSGELSFGQVVGAFGVKGELRVHLHNRGSALLHGGEAVVLVSPSGERLSTTMRTRAGSGGRVLARIPQVSTPEQTVAYLDWEILVSTELLPALEDGEYYHHDILRARVRDTAGVDLGKVVEIHSTGPVEIWVLKLPSGEEAYFPLLLDQLVELDTQAGTIVLKEGSVQCAST